MKDLALSLGITFALIGGSLGMFYWLGTRAIDPTSREDWSDYDGEG